MKHFLVYPLTCLFLACNSQSPQMEERKPRVSHSICSCQLTLPIREEPINIVVAPDTVMSTDLQTVFRCLVDTLEKNGALRKAFLDRSDVIRLAYVADTVTPANAQLIDEANRFPEWKGSLNNDSTDESPGKRDLHSQFKALIAKGNYRDSWENELKRIVGTDVKWSYNLERVPTKELVIKGYDKPFYPVGFDLTLRRMTAEKK